MRIPALLLATVLGAYAEVPLEQVRWQQEFGIPSPGLLAGRAEFVYIFNKTDRSASLGYDKLSWYLHHDLSGDTLLAVMAIGVEASYGVYSEKEVERFARGTDDGGLLRAFAGDKLGVMLVFDPSGRLTELRDPSGVDDMWLHSLHKLAEKATALIDEGSIPGSLRPALPWYLAGDMKKFSAAAAKAQGGDAALKQMAQKAQELADADAKTATDASASGSARLLALQQLQAIAVDFPNVAAAAQKTTKALKDDATIKAEQAAWAGFLDYLAQMKKTRGKGALDTQKQLLAALVAKSKDSYAAEVAAKIAAYAKIDLPAAK